MLFHTMIGSNDIERSKRFYDTVLGTLGIGEPMRNVADSGHTRLIYRGESGTAFIVTQPINDEPATVSNGGTVAFQCDSAEQVKKFHDVAVAAGVRLSKRHPDPSYGIHGNDRTGLCPRSGRQQALRHSFSGLTR